MTFSYLHVVLWLESRRVCTEQRRHIKACTLSSHCDVQTAHSGVTRQYGCSVFQLFQWVIGWKHTKVKIHSDIWSAHTEHAHVDAFFETGADSNTTALSFNCQEQLYPISLEWQVVNCTRATGWPINAKCNDSLKHSAEQPRASAVSCYMVQTTRTFLTHLFSSGHKNATLPL